MFTQSSSPNSKFLWLHKVEFEETSSENKKRDKMSSLCVSRIFISPLRRGWKQRWFDYQKILETRRVWKHSPVNYCREQTSMNTRHVPHLRFSRRHDSLRLFRRNRWPSVQPSPPPVISIFAENVIAGNRDRRRDSNHYRSIDRV